MISNPIQDRFSDLVASKICESDVLRKPGLVEFEVSDVLTKRRLRVIRSRFDGDFGNICRLIVTDANGKQAVDFAPTFELEHALASETVIADLFALFENRVSQGKEDSK